MSESHCDMGRRFFLQVTAATGVAMGCNLRRAPEKLVPYLVPPEDDVPGVPLFYRTACRGCPAGCGVTARTREGRAIKLEGNPEDPIGQGALCARGQAELQALYAPDRIIVSSLAHDYLPFDWRTYRPTFVEAGVTLGAFGWFFFWFLLFITFLPGVSVAETKVELVFEAGEARHG